MSTTLRMPVEAKFPKRTRTEWDAFIRARETLDEQRKRLNREAEALAKTIGEMDRELTAFLETETSGQQEQQLTLKNFILAFLWRKPAAMTLAFAAYRKLTQPAKEELASEVGQQKKLAIQWRVAPPPASPAAE